MLLHYKRLHRAIVRRTKGVSQSSFQGKIGKSTSGSARIITIFTPADVHLRNVNVKRNVFLFDVCFSETVFTCRRKYLCNAIKSENVENDLQCKRVALYCRARAAGGNFAQRNKTPRESAVRWDAALEKKEYTRVIFLQSIGVCNKMCECQIFHSICSNKCTFRTVIFSHTIFAEESRS